MKRKLFLIPVAICLLYVTQVVDCWALSEDKRMEVNAAFEQYVMKQYDYDYNHQCDYLEVDIDRDGKDEMIYRDDTDGEIRLFIYDLKKKKIFNIKTCPIGRYGYVGYNKKKHLVFMGYADTGGSKITVYKLKKNKLKKYKIFKYNNGRHGSVSYKINGKKVSKKKYNKAWKSLKLKRVLKSILFGTG